MPHCNKWTPTHIAIAVAAALLLCTPAVATNETLQGSLEDRCIFDELQRQDMPIGTSRLVQLALRNTSVRASNATTAVAGTYAPIRIRIFSDDLDNPLHYCSEAGQMRPDFKGSTLLCTEGDILTEPKKSSLRRFIIPKAMDLHRDRLKVEAVEGNLIISGMKTYEVCGQFTVPASHETTGVENADFVLYVSAGPTSGRTVAWARPCLYLQNGRPVAGVTNFSPKYVEENYRSVRRIAHEILHALGFNYLIFSPVGMTSLIPSIRGKPGNSSVITSPKVVEAAKFHYGCPSMTFMELEDEGGRRSAYSHWKLRSAKDDLMAGVSSGRGYYTAVTIAAMEDLGYYKGNYDKAEVMPWGRNVGCSLFEEKCVKNGTSLLPSMFCTEKVEVPVCSSDRFALGYCVLQTHDSDLPLSFQYFSNPKLGGREGTLTDYCPIVIPYSHMSCLNGNLNFMPGSVIGNDARCFSAPEASVFLDELTVDVVDAICIDVKCGDRGYSVKVKGADSYVTCEPGKTFSLRDLSDAYGSGSLTCPPESEVCLEYKNPFVAQS